MVQMLNMCCTLYCEYIKPNLIVQPFLQYHKGPHKSNQHLYISVSYFLAGTATVVHLVTAAIKITPVHLSCNMEKVSQRGTWKVEPARTY